MAENNKLTKVELTQTAEENNYNKKYFQLFFTEYDRLFNQVKEEYKEDDYEAGEDFSSVALFLTHLYIKEFIIQMEKGHSEEWSDLYAKSIEENEVTFHETYHAIRKGDANKAKQELITHCLAVRGDEYFTKYFLYIFENEGGLSEPNKKAQLYSESYKKQIAGGRAELFANEYAVNMAADKYSEIYCYFYAKAFENALQQNKSEEYARLYAEKYSDYVGNHYSRIEQLDEDEDFDFNHQQIIGYMKAWEYINENKLHDEQSFIDLYKNIYINTYFSETRDFNLSEEKLDAMILEKVLEKYYYILNK